jgi:prepilin-type N-terminal cleavage/methylation domain-containing protein
MTRRGFTLTELLVAVVVSGFLALLTGGVLAGAATRLRDRSERMGLEHALRVSLGAAAALAEPLGLDSAAGADLTGAGPSTLLARSTRGVGVVCGVEGGRVLARSGAAWWRAMRVPVGGRDSLLIASRELPVRWIPLPLLGPPASGWCPDGSPALALPTAVAPEQLAMLGSGSPLTLFEPVEIRLYSSAGASWVGVRLVATGEAVQPLAGPFADARFEYLDGSGAPAGSPSTVAMIRLALEGSTERAGGLGVAGIVGSQRDSASVLVGLRGRP